MSGQNCSQTVFVINWIMGDSVMSYQIEWCIPLDCVSREGLLKRLNSSNKNFILVDTIGTYNGNRFRIKGATTIPYPEVPDRKKELLQYDEVIVYCKEKSCKASKKTASALKMMNVPNVKVYEGGITEWMAHNLPVEEY